MVGGEAMRTKATPWTLASRMTPRLAVALMAGLSALPVPSVFPMAVVAGQDGAEVMADAHSRTLEEARRLPGAFQVFGDRDWQQPLVSGCGPVFGPHTTLESLAAAFGEANVVGADVHVGEGFYEPGAIIFGDTEDRVDVTWKDAVNGRAPAKVAIYSAGSSWETPRGLRIGLDLHSVEEINGRPFELTGFGWDYSGTVVSWEGGHLETSPGGPCRVVARFSPAESVGDDPDSSRRPARFWVVLRTRPSIRRCSSSTQRFTNC